MDRHTMVVALSGQICGTVLLITILSLWFQRRRRESAAPKDSMQRIESRLSEIQQAIDTVALEVERISEGQRFTTKILAERVPGEMSSGGADGARVAERSGMRR